MVSIQNTYPSFSGVSQVSSNPTLVASHSGADLGVMAWVIVAITAGVLVAVAVACVLLWKSRRNRPAAREWQSGGSATHEWQPGGTQACSSWMTVRRHPGLQLMSDSQEAHSPAAHEWQSGGTQACSSWVAVGRHTGLQLISDSQEAHWPAAHEWQSGGTQACSSWVAVRRNTGLQLMSDSQEAHWPVARGGQVIALYI